MIPSYQSPQRDLRSLILNISNELDWGIAPAQIEIDSLKNPWNVPFKVVIQILGSDVNPKWQFDDIRFSYLTIGANPANEQSAHNAAWAIHNELLGRETTVIGNISYQSFLSNSIPYRATSTQQDRPIYITNMSVNRQILVPEGNRTPLD